MFAVKKTQEVLQFGNQQNRQADTRNYARAEKRRECPPSESPGFSSQRINPFFTSPPIPDIHLSLNNHFVCTPLIFRYRFFFFLITTAEAPDDHHDPEPVPEVNNALDRYPQTSRHEKIADLFYNPGIHNARDAVF